MTKYFKAQVTLQKMLHLGIAAESDEVAREKAKDLALLEMPGCCVSRIEITPDGEIEYGAGIRVKHFIFGIGEIIDLERVTNYKNERLYSAAIRFESGDVKKIGLPLPKEKLEVLQ